jgi:hypothetical protein
VGNSVSGGRGSEAVHGLDQADKTQQSLSSASVARQPRLSSGALGRVILPAGFAVAMAAVIELVLYVGFYPTFWQRTAWLMHDPYRPELFDRIELYVRLSHLEDSDPDIISVGDSSGFFSLQSKVVNRYTGGAKFLSLNTGANQAFIGYRAIAEYMLRRSKHIKYVVLYIYPQLLPVEELIKKADLGPITYDDLASVRSYVTPPSAFLAPYAKALLFQWRRFRDGEPLSNHMPSLQLASTVNDTLGWLPEFDIRYDRVDGRLEFYSDERTGWYNHLGLTEPSSIVANLDEFDRTVRSYGAQLVVAFAPMAQRVITENDEEISPDDRAIERFQRGHPDVKFLFPLITTWGVEKFGMYNHISREYTFLSSERLGKALNSLIRDPQSIPPYQAQAKAPKSYPPVVATPAGAPDPSLLAPALALYLYTSTNDEKYRALLSKRVAGLLDQESAFQAAMADARERIASLARRDIHIGFDLSEMQAMPVEIEGLPHCGAAEQKAEWVQLDGNMIFTYESPAITSREPIRWPRTSHIFVPTVIEDGIRKFDGYCPEPSMRESTAQ